MLPGGLRPDGRLRAVAWRALRVPVPQHGALSTWVGGRVLDLYGGGHDKLRGFGISDALCT